MSKYHFFVGLLAAAFILPTSVGLGCAPDCLMAEVSTDHACCSGQPEPSPASCCPGETAVDPDPRLCSCSQAPESPSGLLPAVPAAAPDLTVVIEAVGLAGAGHTVSVLEAADDSRRTPPGTTVPVFLLDCAFLI